MNSSLPFWILALQALAVPVIALLAAVIGYFQWRTAQQKVVLDLFDRRMATYTALREVVAKVMASSSAATSENSFKFLEARDRAQFLFGPEVIEHLKKIDEAIHEIHDAADRTKRPSHRGRARREHSEGTGWQGNDDELLHHVPSSRAALRAHGSKVILVTLDLSSAMTLVPISAATRCTR